MHRSATRARCAKCDGCDRCANVRRVGRARPVNQARRARQAPLSSRTSTPARVPVDAASRFPWPGLKPRPGAGAPARGRPLRHFGVSLERSDLDWTTRDLTVAQRADQLDVLRSARDLVSAGPAIVLQVREASQVRGWRRARRGPGAPRAPGEPGATSAPFIAHIDHSAFHRRLLKETCLHHFGLTANPADLQLPPAPDLNIESCCVARGRSTK